MRQLIKGSFPMACGYYLLSDWATGLRYRGGSIDTESGTAHSAMSADESVRYVEEVFADYKNYAGVTHFYGRVAEVGPGDNCGVALLFLNDGCVSVDLVDRFYSRRNVRSQAVIYRSIWNRYSGLSPFLAKADLEDERTFKGIERRYGATAAAEEFFVPHTGYDFIVSRSVFEHLYDPLLAIKRMTSALNPGGMLLHKIDLRDHGMFSTKFHELKFLESPDWLHRWMTKASGRPNRVLVHRYRECLEAIQVRFDILITRLASVGDIIPHRAYWDIPEELRKKSLASVRSARHRFASSMRRISDEDLSVAGVFIVARKLA
jgi:SAM-dependent methyltransferase